MKRQGDTDRPSILYRFALATVAVTMAILPCLYAAITLLTGYGVYLFATRYFAEIWAWPIGMHQTALMIKVVCSCTPLLVGGAVAFSMVKPFFARRGRRPQPLALNAEMEPRVHSLVQEVCRTLGAPAPRRIELSCDLNASAHFERGLRGLLRGRLILTLGMPLAVGLTQRELTGIIAHEFGHFRQSAGMRVSYLIRVVNGWFARVIYGRDGWDEILDGWSDGMRGHGFWISIMLGCARLGVGVSRGVLWLLMMAGHAVSAALMRQMEYDADRGEIRLAGSAAFESAFVKFAALEAIMRDLHLEMRRSWRSKFQLPDNLPVLVEIRAARMPADRRAALESKVGLDKTGWLDTHPSKADRIKRARLASAPGYEVSDEPARDLFENFDALSRLVTLAYYEDDLNVPVTPDFLIPVNVATGATVEAVPTPAPPVPARARAAVPMMAYDPSAFQGRKPPVA